MRPFILLVIAVFLSTSALASPNARTISGKIVSLNPEARTISIVSEDQRSITYRYQEGLKVDNKPRQISDMSDLREGETVVLTLEAAN